MDNTLSMYQNRICYWSQVARLAAVEKNIQFERIDIDPFTAENLEDDFLRMNPSSELPVLRFGETTVCGSQEIIDFLDRLQQRVTDAEDRPEIDVFRRRCDAMRINEISYGISLNPHLLNGAKFPAAFLEKLARRADYRSVLERKVESGSPEQRSVYLDLLGRVMEFNDTIATPVKLQGLLRSLDEFLADVNTLLRNNSRQAEKEEGELWLFGKDFTNGDVYLACILARVDMLGLAGKFWDETERVYLADYYRRLKRRPSFQQECVPILFG